jgi:hypothetical protein
MRLQLLRYFMPHVPLVGAGWVDFTRTVAVDSDLNNQMASKNEDGVPQFRLELGSTTVFTDPVPGIVDACFEVGAQFASDARNKMIMDLRLNPDKTESFVLKKEAEAWINANPWNHTDAQFPPYLNFTESKIDPLNVKEHYRFFVLLAVMRSESHNKDLATWSKNYEPDDVLTIVENIITSEGDYSVTHVDEKTGEKKDERFYLKGLTKENTTEGPMQVFGVRKTEYDALMKKRGLLKVTPPAAAAAAAADVVMKETTKTAEADK